MLAASDTVGAVLKTGDIVVYESTVYPGAIEEDCLPVLEKTSGLASGRDFTVGYSPERINPGDKKHRFETITKVVVGAGRRRRSTSSPTSTARWSRPASIARRSIKVAEAAKVIENTQRDLNIAFMNELSAIFHQLGIDTGDVLAAAATKWNFLQLPARPGRRPLHRRRSLLPHLSAPRRPATIPRSSWPAGASTTTWADAWRASACARCCSAGDAQSAR